MKKTEISKVKMTKKMVLETNKNVYAVGYCALQRLLHYRKPYAYTAGAYGWNADIYAIGEDAIATGYRPFGKRIPWEIIDKFEKAADYILKQDVNQSYKESLLYGLLDAMLKEVKEGGK